MSEVSEQRAPRNFLWAKWRWRYAAAAVIALALTVLAKPILASTPEWLGLIAIGGCALFALALAWELSLVLMGCAAVYWAYRSFAEAEPAIRAGIVVLIAVGTFLYRIEARLDRIEKKLANR